MTRFLLIRHATTDSVGKRLSGRLPGVHLNDLGRAQALHLASMLAHLPLSAIYSSPLERAQETADPLARMLNSETILNEDFLEIDSGDWTNCTFQELDTQEAFQRFNRFRSIARIPGGETMAEAQQRMVSGIDKLCTKHSGQTIAVVSHSDLIKATIAYYAGIHLDMFQRIEISPASVSILELGSASIAIKGINYTGLIQFS